MSKTFFRYRLCTYIFLIYYIQILLEYPPFLHYFTNILTQCGLLPKVQHFIEVISILQRVVSWSTILRDLFGRVRKHSDDIVDPNQISKISFFGTCYCQPAGTLNSFRFWQFCSPLIIIVLYIDNIIKNYSYYNTSFFQVYTKSPLLWTWK